MLDRLARRRHAWRPTCPAARATGSERAGPPAGFRLGLAACFLLTGLASWSGLGAASAPEGAQDLAPWFTVDAGGGTSGANTFSISGTIGQLDTGESTATGSGLVLVAGYWSNAPFHATLFADGFDTGDTSRWSAEVP